LSCLVARTRIELVFRP